MSDTGDRATNANMAARWAAGVGATVAFVAGVLIIVGGIEASQRFGQPATYFAISAGLAGTVLAVIGHQHNRQQLRQATQVANDAEVDRGIEREIQIRRHAVDSMAEYQKVLKQLKPTVDMSGSIATAPLQRDQSGRLQAVTHQHGTIDIPQFVKGVIDMIDGKVGAPEIRALAATNGTELFAITKAAAKNIDSIRRTLDAALSELFDPRNPDITERLERVATSFAYLEVIANRDFPESMLAHGNAHLGEIAAQVSQRIQSKATGTSREPLEK